jgi:hypothetical protein
MIELNVHCALNESGNLERDQDEQDSLRAEQDEQEWLRTQQETLTQHHNGTAATARSGKVRL